jgi:hypothetical protein
MSVSTQPPPAPKKRRLGCLGCGCLVLALLAILFLGLITALGYYLYSGAMLITSATPSTVQTFDGGDDIDKSARQKLADFDHDLHNHLAATIHLNANEINTLIAHDPDFTKNNIHFFVSLNDNQARVQTSVPTDILSYRWFPGRYLNGDVTFLINFDSASKSLNFTPQNIQLGDQVVMGQNSGSTSTTNSTYLQSFISRSRTANW